ncbi:MAG: AAA family ATPase [Alphaproteobacteria bacterium]|nr:AAA family ATPase [Alphaproteobacteria bacterium]
MRINRLIIKDYRNLKDIHIDFPDSNMIAFIGNNGSGKSNLLELIARVFAYTKNSLIKGKQFPSPNGLEECEIDYIYNGNQYALKYSRGNVLLIRGIAEIVKKSEIENVLPKSIFLYYSGETKRLAEIESKTIDEKYNNALKSNKFGGYKFTEYFSTTDLDILLLTVAVYEGALNNIVNKYTNGLRLYRPFNLLIANPRNSSAPGGEYFGATGFVRAFLDQMRKYVARTEEYDNYLHQKRRAYSMGFTDVDEIKKVASGPSDFFAKMKALKNSGYLEKVIINFHKGNKPVLLDNLSEGEKQILLMKLLTQITGQDDCLYLFDEFDSFLHPQWQRKFVEELSTIEINGQILFTTHSPLTLGKMRKENIRILKGGKVYAPAADTYNRDITEVLEEIMDVGKRPKEVEDAIIRFRNAAVHGDKEKAHIYYGELRDYLSADDPFWVTAEHLLARL